MARSPVFAAMKWLALLGLAVPFACGKADSNPTASTGGEESLGGRRGIGNGDPRVDLPVQPGGGGAAPVEGLLEYCTTGAGISRGDPEGDLLIDDFDDGDSGFFGNGLSSGWFSYGDGTGYQTPGGAWEPEAGGLTEGGYAAHIVGGEFTEWGSGNGFIFASREDRTACLFDGAAYNGITFWARGSLTLEYPEDPAKQPPEEYQNLLRVHVLERDVVPEEYGGECSGSCWDAHKTRIALSECWQKFVIPFSTLAQDGFGSDAGELDLEELYELVFEVPPYQAFDFWIDDLRFYTGKNPEPEMGACPDVGAGGAGGAGGASH